MSILFPDSAYVLIDELDKMFPERPATPTSSREDDLFYGGKRELVRFLKTWRDKSRESTPPITRRQRR